jgi:hypothetical protein
MARLPYSVSTSHAKHQSGALIQVFCGVIDISSMRLPSTFAGTPEQDQSLNIALHMAVMQRCMGIA